MRKQTVPSFCGGIRQSVAHITGKNIANEDSVFKIVAPQKAGITLELTPCRKKKGELCGKEMCIVDSYSTETNNTGNSFT